MNALSPNQPAAHDDPGLEPDTGQEEAEQDEAEALAEALEHTERGIRLAKAGKLEQAIAAYDEAILAADHLPALLNRACAYFHLGDHRRAERDCSFVLELDEGRHRMWLMRGIARAQLGDEVGAAEDLERYLSFGRQARYRAVAKRTLRAIAFAA